MGFQRIWPRRFAYLYVEHPPFHSPMGIPVVRKLVTSESIGYLTRACLVFVFVGLASWHASGLDADTLDNKRNAFFREVHGGTFREENHALQTAWKNATLSKQADVVLKAIETKIGGSAPRRWQAMLNRSVSGRPPRAGLRQLPFTAPEVLDTADFAALSKFVYTPIADEPLFGADGYGGGRAIPYACSNDGSIYVFRKDRLSGTVSIARIDQGTSKVLWHQYIFFVGGSDNRTIAIDCRFRADGDVICWANDRNLELMCACLDDKDGKLLHWWSSKQR